MKIQDFSWGFALIFSGVLTANEVPHNFKPASGYVPDEATAIRIAVAVWEPIYGAEHIAKKSRSMPASKAMFG